MPRMSSHEPVHTAEGSKRVHARRNLGPEAGRRFPAGASGRAMSPPAAPTDENAAGEAMLADVAGPAHAPGGSSTGKPGLTRNFSWTFAGNVSVAAAQWLMVVVLAKRLGPEAVGQYALATAIATPVLLLANANLRPILATDAAREYSFGEYFALRLATTVGAFAVLLAYAVFGAHLGSFGLTLGLLAVERALAAVVDVFYGLLDREEQMDRVAIGLLLRSVLTLGAFAAGALVHGLPGALGGAIAVSVLALVVYDLPVIARATRAEPGGLRPVWIRERLLRLLTMAAPLAVSGSVASLGLLLPRYLLRHQLGERELGIFAALLYPMNVGGLVVTALGYSMMPRMARHFAAGELSAFRRRQLHLVIVGAGFAAAGLLVSAVAGRGVLAILYTHEYATRVDLLLWLMAAAGAGYVATAWDSAMTAARALSAQLPIMLATLAATLLGCLWAIPHYGAIGGAVGMLVGALTRMAGGAWVLHRTLSARARALAGEG